MSKYNKLTKEDKSYLTTKLEGFSGFNEILHVLNNYNYEIVRLNLDKEKTAKEMFKELDYELIVTNNKSLSYFRKHNLGVEKKGFEITFNKINRTFIKSLFGQFYPFTFDENKAINKQLEELGWE